MNKLLISSIILCMVLNVNLYSQNTTIKIQLFEEANNNSIIGATAYFKQLEIGATTNEEGLAILDNIPLGKQVLTISYIGFETIIDTLIVAQTMPLKAYYLKESEFNLESFTVKATRSSRTIEKIPTRVEFIGGEELGEKALMNAANISLVLRESTGIQIQQTSLSSANSNIRIQGLDGRYTQILKDGFPLFSGFSGGLSINQIPPLDLQQFEIIKGSASTLYGGGAISGLVNLVSKTPEEDPELTIQLAQTHVGGSTVNAFYSKRKDKFGYTLYGSGNYHNIYDPDDDGFSNIPETQTFSFNPKIFYYPSKKTTLWLGVNGIYDKREGGDVIAIQEGANEINQFKELNTSTRISTQAVYKKKITEKRALQVKSSFSYFDRELETPFLLFSGTQSDVFTEINYTTNTKKSDWIIGGNFYSNSFKENDNLNPRNQDDITFGVFANNTTDLSNKFILETGFRADFSPDWGISPLPRISLLWKPNSKFSSRIGGGLGYRIPDLFTEEAATLNFENILPINKDILDAERSSGVNIDFNYTGNLSDKISYSINQLFYLTSIDNALLLNEQTNGSFLFENADGNILSRGAETNIKFTYNKFRWLLSYSNINVTLNYLPNNPQRPLTARHMAGSILTYETDKWRIGYETYYTGSQKLSSGANTQDFVVMGLLVQRHFKWGSPYINFENFTDRRQSRFSAEVLPPRQSPQFEEIYAPTDGFVFTIGVVITPFGREDEEH